MTFNKQKIFKQQLISNLDSPLSQISTFEGGFHTHKRGVAETPIFYKQSILYDFSDFRNLELEIFKNHICFGKEKVIYQKNCKKCNSVLTYENGETVTYCWVCGSPYCQDEDCFNQRCSIAKEYFMIFFNAHPSWKTERGNRWIHETFGFKRQSLPTRKELNMMRNKVNKFLKALEKEFKIRIKGIGVRDLAYDIKKIGEEFYIHFHFARRPTKEIDFKEVNNLGEKFGLKYVYNGYRKAYWLADYFSKRHAGQFGHKKDKSNWRFADVMNIETYFKLFHNSRKSLYYGFTRKEVKFLKDRAEQIRKSEAFALSSNAIPTGIPTACSKCGCKEFNLILYEEIPKQIIKPPPDTLKIVVEYIKIPILNFVEC